MNDLAEAAAHCRPSGRSPNGRHEPWVSQFPKAFFVCERATKAMMMRKMPNTIV